MPIATGVFKKLAMKRQTAKGVVAPAGAAGSSRYVRRVTSTLDLTKATYQSAEVNESQQVRDMRHGVRSTAGTLNGELSVGGYQIPLEGLLRKLAVAGVSVGPLATISSTLLGGRAGNFTRGAGSWLADGFKVGDVIRPSGWATTGVPFNGRNFMVTAVTALVLTVMAIDASFVFITKAAGDPVTIAVIGRKIWVPDTNQIRDYVTVEHWHADIAQSELFPDVVFTGANIALPPSGMATIELPMMGIDMTPGVAQYFTTPAASPAGAILAAVNGLLIIDGVAVGLLTGLTINITGNHAYPDQNGVVGSNVHTDISPGVLGVTGQATVLFQDAVLRDKFLNETECSICAVLTADNTAGADFTSFVMSRVKFSGATKDDTPTGITLTMPFTALENMTGGAAVANLQTTISIQDSLFT
jgi:hypothetical protein